MTDDILIELGFKYVGQCHCNGTLNRKFQKSNYILYLMPKRHQFFVKEYNKKVVPVKPMKELEETINILNAAN